MSRPAIAAPVSRSIAVADTVRAAAYYRDVLGFEVREGAGAVEAVNGPVRVRFEPGDPVSAMLFFETGDLAGMHASLHAAGAAPSGIERVNIKFAMFAVRDPDPVDQGPARADPGTADGLAVGVHGF
jgi:catechol 2,3-dioxygenase-like lactoylglutathione lyase family enzyme